MNSLLRDHTGMVSCSSCIPCIGKLNIPALPDTEKLRFRSGPFMHEVLVSSRKQVA